MSEIVRVSEMLLFDRKFSFGLALALKQAQLLAVVTLLHVLATFVLAAWSNHVGHFHTWTINVPVNRGSDNRGSPIPHPHIELGERCSLLKHRGILFGLGHWTGLLVTGLPAGLTCSWLAVVADPKGSLGAGSEPGNSNTN